MSYMLFKNKGLMDINALRLLGASTKRGSNDKIGFFGSGWKYSLAVMLRENISFRIFVGKKEIIVQTTSGWFFYLNEEGMIVKLGKGDQADKRPGFIHIFEVDGNLTINVIISPET